MIETITKSQEKKIPVYLNKWLKIGLRTKAIDRKKAKKSVHFLYEKILKMDKPKYLIFLDYFSKGEAVSAQDGDKILLRVKKAAIISHGRGKSTEHASKPIPVGDYWVEIQTEFDHLKEESRKVID